MNARLEDRISRPDRLIQALAGVAAALSLTLVGWLIAVEVSDTGVRHLPAVHVDNQTHLTLQVQVVDQHGARLTLGAHPPGPSSRLEVADLGPTWTFQTSYGGQQVNQQTLDRTARVGHHGCCGWFPLRAASHGRAAAHVRTPFARTWQAAGGMEHIEHAPRRDRRTRRGLVR